jgi:hypothetical protein
MATPKLLEAACKGTHLPDDDGSDENFVYEGPENADGPAVQTGAWVADVTYEGAPHGENSLGLWQINVDSAQTDNPDTFDCSEIVQWASAPAVRTGAGIADVTYDEPSSAPPFAKPVTFTATVSNSEPVTHAGWGPWEDNPSLNEDLGIAWVSGDGGTRNLGNDAVFITNLTGGDHGSSILEFSVENFPNNFSAGPSPLESDYQGTHLLYQDVTFL